MMLLGTVAAAASGITSSPSLTMPAAASGTNGPHENDDNDVPTLRCPCVLIGGSLLRQPWGLTAFDACHGHFKS